MNNLPNLIMIVKYLNIGGFHFETNVTVMQNTIKDDIVTYQSW